MTPTEYYAKNRKRLIECFIKIQTNKPKNNNNPKHFQSLNKYLSWTPENTATETMTTPTTTPTWKQNKHHPCVVLDSGKYSNRNYDDANDYTNMATKQAPPERFCADLFEDITNREVTRSDEVKELNRKAADKNCVLQEVSQPHTGGEKKNNNPKAQRLGSKEI